MTWGLLQRPEETTRQRRNPQATRTREGLAAPHGAHAAGPARREPTRGRHQSGAAFPCGEAAERPISAALEGKGRALRRPVLVRASATLALLRPRGRRTWPETRRLGMLRSPSGQAQPWPEYAAQGTGLHSALASRHGPQFPELRKCRSASPLPQRAPKVTLPRHTGLAPHLVGIR